MTTALTAQREAASQVAERTSLYRFYDAREVLLYIGITNSLPRRFGRHGEEKSWYHEVAYVKVEHYPNRKRALEAERLAIKAECPRFNIQHNTGSGRGQQPGVGRWRYFSRRYRGPERREDIYLYPELECSSMVDDYYDLDGDGQMREYVRYLARRYPEVLRQDKVPIYWTVQPACETAPAFLDSHYAEIVGDNHFLAHFTWPEDAVTRERLDWFSLPVINDRFPEFAEALAWSPSPLQPFCPLRTILTARGMGHYFEGL